MADHRICHQQILGTRVHHDLRFGDFGHREARRAAGQLALADQHRFVGLGVRTQAQGMLGCVPSHSRQIALHYIQVHDQRRGIDFRDSHPSRIWGWRGLFLKTIKIKYYCDTLVP